MLEKLRSLFAESGLGVSTWVAIIVAVFVTQMLHRRRRNEDN